MAFGATDARCDFTFESEIQLGTAGNCHGGLDFDGTNWRVARVFTDEVFVYSASFDFLGAVAIAGVVNSRSVVVDDNTGNMFVLDGSFGIVRETTSSGNVVAFFAVPPSTNSMAYDSTNDQIWLVTSEGLVQQRTRTGQILSSFQVDEAPAWNGLAIDELNNTLLMISSIDDFFPITVFEYSTQGNLIDTLLIDSLENQLVTNIPFEIAYDSTNARLDVVGHVGFIATYSDPSRLEKSNVILGDVNLDGVVDLLDVGPFVDLIVSGTFQAEGDINQDGIVDLLDVGAFIDLLN